MIVLDEICAYIMGMCEGGVKSTDIFGIVGVPTKDSANNYQAIQRRWNLQGKYKHWKAQEAW